MRRAPHLLHCKIVFLTLLSEALLSAQTTPSAIGGIVCDTSHGVLTDVEIMLVNQDTGAWRKMHTNESGRFLFPALPPGVYRLTASRAKFKSVLIPDLGLQIDQRRELDVEMETGGITETVTVSASATSL